MSYTNGKDAILVDQLLGTGFEFFEPYTNQHAEIINFRFEKDHKAIIIDFKVTTEEGLTTTGSCRLLIQMDKIKFVKIGEKI